MEHEKPINPKVLAWFESRGIDPERVARMGIYSGRHVATGDSFVVEPDLGGNVIVFPYLRRGVPRNEKFRAAGKKFYQRPGGEKLFWNVDVLSDPSLSTGHNPLVIVEGEMDALSVLEAGHPFVVSVPDGAPPAMDDISTDEIVPEHDTKYSYIFKDWEALKKIKRIVIATDNDGPGRRLAEELVRRLGRVRCSFIEYPEDCKDFNDILLKRGNADVIHSITFAKPYPVSGIYTFADLPPEPDLRPVTTGWGRLNGNLNLFYPAFMVVTGLAGSGKSTWVNQLVAQMCVHHGWRSAIASFEMRIKPFVTDTLLNTYALNHEEEDDDPIQAVGWLTDNFVFIAPEPSDENETFDIDWLIEKAEAAVIRHGIRILVIDPWNEVEHALAKGETMTDYTGRAIRALKRFGREFECLVIVVAHPSKEGANRPAEEISLYDISSSAHFANKADFGVTIARYEGSAIAGVFVKKVRYQPISGLPGSIQLVFDPETGTFGQ